MNVTGIAGPFSPSDRLHAMAGRLLVRKQSKSTASPIGHGRRSLEINTRAKRGGSRVSFSVKLSQAQQPYLYCGSGLPKRDSV